MFLPEELSTDRHTDDILEGGDILGELRQYQEWYDAVITIETRRDNYSPGGRVIKRGTPFASRKQRHIIHVALQYQYLTLGRRGDRMRLGVSFRQGFPGESWISRNRKGAAIRRSYSALKPNAFLQILHLVIP